MTAQREDFAERVDPLWPPLLCRPSTPPTVVYLDLNHWIGLSKAATNHPDGAAYRQPLETCRSAKATGSAVFPLSTVHYVEMQGIKDPSQRRCVAAVMEELSGFITMLGRPSIFRLEIEAVLDQMLGPANMPLPALPLLGRGCAWAFGRIVKPTFHDGAGHEVTDQVRQDWSGGPAAFDAWYAAVELRMERSFLAGPADDEEMELREHGWRPESTRQIVEGRAAQEQEQVGRLDAEPRWRRGRLFDVVAAREVLIELNEALWEALDRRGKRDLDGLFDDRVAARRFIRMMPSTEVAVELKRAAHRNSELGWITNDVHDIDAMSIAVPYADVVVTEKHMHHVLHAADLPQRMGTVVLRRMSDVALHL